MRCVLWEYSKIAFIMIVFSYLNDLTRELMEELGLDDRQMTRKFISAFKGDLDVCRDKFEDSGGKLLDVFEKTHFVQLVFPYKPLGFRFSVDLSCHHPYITFVVTSHILIYC